MDFAYIMQLTIGAIFVHNLVLAKFLGLCPFFGVTKRFSPALYLGIAVSLVAFLTALITKAAVQFLLIPLHMDYLQIPILILLITILTQCIELIMQKISRPVYETVGMYLPVVGTNCATLGIALLCLGRNPYTGDIFSYGEALIYSLASGIGFAVVALLMSGIRERLEFARTPQPLKGLPISFISAGLMALIFMGFSAFGGIGAGR